mmetsp:Transcript_14040/g.33651  ORF Transcript_14040/g.33651 Transcript_14040/m.33651 type:complete len:284 (+) Transcript_14040:2553-3404(+)
MRQRRAPVRLDGPGYTSGASSATRASPGQWLRHRGQPVARPAHLVFLLWTTEALLALRVLRAPQRTRAVPRLVHSAAQELSHPTAPHRRVPTAPLDFISPTAVVRSAWSALQGVRRPRALQSAPPADLAPSLPPLGHTCATPALPEPIRTLPHSRDAAIARQGHQVRSPVQQTPACAKRAPPAPQHGATGPNPRAFLAKLDPLLDPGLVPHFASSRLWVTQRQLITLRRRCSAAPEHTPPRGVWCSARPVRPTTTSPTRASQRVCRVRTAPSQKGAGLPADAA